MIGKSEGRSLSIVVVEDDEMQSEYICDGLKGLLDCEVQGIHSESEFRTAISSFSTHPPDIVVMDLMLVWADLGDPAPRPPFEYFEEGGMLFAGLRCVQLLRKSPETEHIPVVLYSVLSATELRSTDLPDRVYCLSKSKDVDLLAELIREVTS